MNHQRQWFQLKIFTVLLREKRHLHLAWPRVGKLTANFHFWMNYPFNQFHTMCSEHRFNNLRKTFMNTDLSSGRALGTLDGTIQNTGLESVMHIVLISSAGHLNVCVCHWVRRMWRAGVLYSSHVNTPPTGRSVFIEKAYTGCTNHSAWEQRWAQTLSVGALLH